MKIIAFVILCFCCAILFLLLLYLIFSSLLFKKYFGRKKKKFVDEKIEKWWEGCGAKKVFIETDDKLKLCGYFVDNFSKQTVIVVHGYGECAKRMQRYCKFFYNNHFNVLAVDNRAHGESQGDCVGFAWKDSDDLLKWIEFVSSGYDTKIVLFGVSMGASAVCLLCGKDLPKNVVGAISDCAFSNGLKQIKFESKGRFFGKFCCKILVFYLKHAQNFDLSKIDIAGEVKKSKIPVLFIHGQKDDVVLVSNAFELYSALPKNLSSKWICDDSGHAETFELHPKDYEKHVLSFLKNKTSLYL